MVYALNHWTDLNENHYAWQSWHTDYSWSLNFLIFFTVDYFDPVTLSDNEPEVCLIQAREDPNNCFKRLCWTLPYLASIILFQIFIHPKIPVVFNTNAKKAKNEDFLISSIISTAVNFKVLCCFLICYSVFWWHAMKSDSNPVFSNVRHCICVFCIN